MASLNITDAKVSGIVTFGTAAPFTVTVSVEATVEKSAGDQNFVVAAKLFKRGTGDTHTLIEPEISLAPHATTPNLYIGTFPATDLLAPGQEVYVKVTADADYRASDANSTMTKSVPAQVGGFGGEYVVPPKTRRGRHK